MKFILIIFFSIIYSQNSLLSLYGVGQKIDVSDISGVALGNSNLFANNKYNISSNAPSSLWKSSLTRFVMQYRFNISKYANIDNQYENNLNYFSFSFPIGPKRVLGFGLNPAYIINNSKIIEESNNVQNIQYSNTFNIYGGISKLFMQYSQKVNSNISLGLQYSFLFGNNIIENLILLNGNNTIYSNKSFKYSSSELVSELRYLLYKQEIVIRLEFYGKTKIKKIIDDYYQESISKPMLSAILLGFNKEISNKSGFIAEIQYREPFNTFNTDFDLFGYRGPIIHSGHLGVYSKYQNPSIGFWNMLNISAGGYVKQLNYNNNQLYDIGATVGLGIEYLMSSHSIDIAFKIGQKESLILLDRKESYIAIHIGMTTGEKWFMKTRRK